MISWSWKRFGFAMSINISYLSLTLLDRSLDELLGMFHLEEHSPWFVWEWELIIYILYSHTDNDLKCSAETFVIMALYLQGIIKDNCF